MLYRTREKGRAAVWIDSRKIKVMEIPIPKAEEDGAVIKINATAICVRRPDGD